MQFLWEILFNGNSKLWLFESLLMVSTWGKKRLNLNKRYVHLNKRYALPNCTIAYYVKALPHVVINVANIVDILNFSRWCQHNLLKLSSCDIITTNSIYHEIWFCHDLLQDSMTIMQYYRPKRSPCHNIKGFQTQNIKVRKNFPNHLTNK